MPTRFHLPVLASLAAGAALSQSFALAAQKAEHPLLICAREFAEPATAMKDSRPLPVVTGGELGFKHPRMLFVTNRTIPADPLGGPNEWKEDWNLSWVFGTRFPVEIQDSGEVIAKPGLGPAGGSSPFYSGELVSVSVDSYRSKDTPIPFSVEVTSRYRHSVTRGQGALQHESREPVGLSIQVSGGASCETLKATLGKLFRPATAEEVAGWEKTHPEITNGTIVPSLREGMSPEEVEAILGTPEKKATIGGKTLYFYQKMKVTFTAGKVTGIE